MQLIQESLKFALLDSVEKHLGRGVTVDEMISLREGAEKIAAQFLMLLAVQEGGAQVSLNDNGELEFSNLDEAGDYSSIFARINPDLAPDYTDDDLLSDLDDDSDDDEFGDDLLNEVEFDDDDDLDDGLDDDEPDGEPRRARNYPARR